MATPDKPPPDEDLDDPATLHRHNVRYRWRVLVVLAIVLLIATVLR